MLLGIAVLAASILLPGSASAVGNNYINPDEGKCNVQLPPNATPILYRNGGTKISYNMDLDEGVLEAVCHFKDSGVDLDRAWVFTEDAYNFPYRCLIKIGGDYHYTNDFHVTLTPSGNVKLRCVADLFDCVNCN
jgi:hypothetical protein